MAGMSSHAFWPGHLGKVPFRSYNNTITPCTLFNIFLMFHRSTEVVTNISEVVTKYRRSGDQNSRSGDLHSAKLNKAQERVTTSPPRLHILNIVALFLARRLLDGHLQRLLFWFRPVLG